MYLVEACLRFPKLATQYREPACWGRGRWMVKPPRVLKVISAPSTGTSDGGNSRCRDTAAPGDVTWQGSRVGQLVRSWITS